MFAVLGMDWGEIIFVVAAALILFGANKIPQFAKYFDDDDPPPPAHT